MNIQIYSDPAYLQKVLLDEFDKYFKNLDKLVVGKFYSQARNHFDITLKEVLNDVEKNFISENQELLSKRNLSENKKTSFIKELPEGTLAVYYPNPNIENLSSSSGKIKPLVVCNCSVLPFTHFYQIVPNQNKGYCRLASPRSNVVINLKHVLLVQPDLLLCTPEYETKRASKLRIGASDSHKVMLTCPTCTNTAENTTQSYVYSVIDSGSWQCRSCSARAARDVAFEKREKVSEHKMLLQTFWPHQKAKPSDITTGSSKKVWWCCSFCNQVYECEPRRRNFISNCPCVSRSMSTPQLILFLLFNEVLGSASTNSNKIKVLLENEILAKRPVDILIESHPRVAIEYDGAYYHGEERKQSDTMKTIELIDKGCLVIRLREPGCADFNPPEGSFCLQLSSSEPKSETFISILEYITQLELIPLEITAAWRKYKEEKGDYLKSSIEELALDISKINNFKIKPSKDEVTLEDELPGIGLIWADKEMLPSHFRKGVRGFGLLSFNNNIHVDFKKICTGNDCSCGVQNIQIHKLLGKVRGRGAGQQCKGRSILDLKRLEKAPPNVVLPATTNKRHVTLEEKLE